MNRGRKTYQLRERKRNIAASREILSAEMVEVKVTYLSGMVTTRPPPLHLTHQKVMNTRTASCEVVYTRNIVQISLQNPGSKCTLLKGTWVGTRRPWGSNRQPFDQESHSLTIRSRLPPCSWYSCHEVSQEKGWFCKIGEAFRAIVVLRECHQCFSRQEKISASVNKLPFNTKNSWDSLVSDAANSVTLNVLIKKCWRQ